MHHISIKGLDKATLLAAFYNHARPIGMGHIADMNKTAERGGEMSLEEARKIIADKEKALRDLGLNPSEPHRLYFDYVFGRPLKIDLGCEEMSTRLYDRDQGEGQGARIIELVREMTGASGNVGT